MWGLVFWVALGVMIGETVGHVCGVQVCLWLDRCRRKRLHDSIWKDR